MNIFLLGGLLGACVPVVKPTGSGLSAEGCLDCKLDDSNQFEYEADLTAAVIPLAERRDAVVRWDGLSRDLHGHPRDAVSDIDSAWLVVFRDFEPPEILDALAHDDLPQSAISLFVTCEPLDAACRLSDFSLMGGSVDVVPSFTEGDTTWLVVLNSPREVGASSMAVIQPTAGSDASEAIIGDDSANLDVEVDFARLEPLSVVGSTPALALDWAGVTVDGLGNPLNTAAIDSLFLGRYDAPRQELASKVFDLEATAAESWEMPLEGGHQAELARLEGETPFNGIQPGSTWLLALRCSSCINPAPRLVTFLEAAP